MGSKPKIDRLLIGRRITQARALAGLTQEQLAASVGVARRTVNHWENGTRAPLRHLPDLERALGVPREWLLWGAQEPPGAEFFRMAKMLHQLQQDLHEVQQDLRELKQSRERRTP